MRQKVCRNLPLPPIATFANDPPTKSRQCGRGGIGRRAALRSLWGNTRGSSSLLDRTIHSLTGRLLSNEVSQKGARYRSGRRIKARALQQMPSFRTHSTWYLSSGTRLISESISDDELSMPQTAKPADRPGALVKAPASCSGWPALRLAATSFGGLTTT